MRLLKYRFSVYRLISGLLVMSFLVYIGMLARDVGTYTYLNISFKNVCCSEATSSLLTDHDGLPTSPSVAPTKPAKLVHKKIYNSSTDSVLRTDYPADTKVEHEKSAKIKNRIDMRTLPDMTPPQVVRNCIRESRSVSKVSIGRNKLMHGYVGQTPATNQINAIIEGTFKRLPSNTAQTFCKKLSQLEDRENVTFTKLSSREKWGAALSIFSSLGYSQRLPNLLGIGVKKSGTNAFEHFLKQHPLVRVPFAAQELHYFDKNYRKGIKYYQANLPIVNEDELCFEKTPKYFVTDSAPSNIARDVSPNMKFILCVRDPVKRVISDWRHEKIVKLNNQGKGVCQGCTAKSEGKDFLRAILTKNGTVCEQNEIVDTSNYARHFEKWLKVFPRDQFLVVREEDISRTPFEVLREAEEFLNIPHFFRREMFVFQKEKICFRATGGAEGVGTLSCPPVYGPAVPKPEVPESVVQKLRDFYRPQNRRFEELSGMNFSWTNL